MYVLDCTHTLSLTYSYDVQSGGRVASSGLFPYFSRTGLLPVILRDRIIAGKIASANQIRDSRIEAPFLMFQLANESASLPGLMIG